MLKLDMPELELAQAVPIPTAEPTWPMYVLLAFFVSLFLRNFLMLVSNHDKQMADKDKAHEAEKQMIVRLYDARITDLKLLLRQQNHAVVELADKTKQAVEVAVEVAEKKVL